MRRGVVTRFNTTTWWGRIKLDDEEHLRGSRGGRSIDFHGTSFRGMTPRYAPKVHQPVLVIFSDETRERLLSVEACA
jgi:hypothetical protein